jgi:hypothetical protein
MALKITMPNPQQVGTTINEFISDVSGTGQVIDVLMDLWMYANMNEDFKELDEPGRVNMFFVLKRTLSFVAEMETSIKNEWIESPKIRSNK